MKPSRTMRYFGWSFHMVLICFLLSAGISDTQAQSEKGKSWTVGELRLKCADQPRARIREWFGTPDRIDLSGKYWEYQGMKIQDPDSGKTFRTLIFWFTSESGGNVSDVRFSDAE